MADALDTPIPSRIWIASWGKQGRAEPRRVLFMVRMERLELSRVAPLEPKSSASTNFATFACGIMFDYTLISGRLTMQNAPGGVSRNGLTFVQH